MPQPSPPDPTDLSRRERQIMDAVFALGEATVNQVVAAISDAPTAMAVRRTMHILEGKGHLQRHGTGREVVYRPTMAKEKAGQGALQRVLQTFFAGSLEEALASHLVSRNEGVTAEERDRLVALIENSRKEGR